MDTLPGGLWRTQGARNARIDSGVFLVELQRLDGSWVQASAGIDAPVLANFDGVFVPTQSEPHLRQLMPTGQGLNTQEQTQVATATITAAAVIAGAIIAAL